MRGEHLGEGAAAQDGRADRFDGERCAEDPLARARYDRVDDKPELVDQAGLDHPTGGVIGTSRRDPVGAPSTDATYPSSETDV